MAIPEDATPVDYTILVYTKTEIDDINNTESARVNSELAKKIDNQLIGSPTGLATLNSTGHVPNTELDIATTQETIDGLDATKMVTPKTLQEKFDVEKTAFESTFIANTEKANINGVATLDGNTTVPLAQIPSLDYVSNAKVGVANGVAPVDANGKIPSSFIPVVQQTQTFYVNTEAEMLALIGVLKSDRCIVFNDPIASKNGEYLALLNNPLTINDWGSIPANNSVTSVNGRVGLVTISASEFPEIAANTADITNLYGQVNAITVPPAPLSDGLYNLQVLGGVPTWVLV